MMRAEWADGFHDDALPTSTVRFVVPGAARGKARPQVTRRGQHVFTPDPGGWVELVGQLGLVCRQDVGVNLMESGPVWLSVGVRRAMPKGWSQRKRDAQRGTYAVRTPDLVNVYAAVCDGLQGVFYRNDNQVVMISATQVWGDEHETAISLVAPW